MSASLLYCVAKEDVPAGSVKTEATVKMVRNEQKRMRIGGMEVRLQVTGELAESARMKRCLDLGTLAPAGAGGLLLYMLFGVLMTVLTQSSSAAIAITLTAATGVV